MIGWLEGVWRNGVVVTSAGVGYVVSAPRIGLDGTRAELWVTTVVREDSISLWGFETQTENIVFAALLRVQGIGVTAAMALLREAGVDKVVSAVASKDAAALRVKGVGQKGAERIIQDVQLPQVVIDEADVVLSAHEEIAVVLVGLGFDPKDADRAARAAVEEHAAEGEQAWLAHALAALRSAQ
jgi:Holliday junction DNA helicase RuvA